MKFTELKNQISKEFNIDIEAVLKVVNTTDTKKVLDQYKATRIDHEFLSYGNVYNIGTSIPRVSLDIFKITEKGFTCYIVIDGHQTEIEVEFELEYPINLDIHETLFGYEMTIEGGLVKLENTDGYITLVDEPENLSDTLDLVGQLIEQGWTFDTCFMTNYFQPGNITFDENNVAYYDCSRFDSIDELEGLIALANITNIGGHYLNPVGEWQARPLSRLEQRGLAYILAEVIYNFEEQEFGESHSIIKQYIRYNETYIDILDGDHNNYPLGGNVAIDMIFAHQDRVVLRLEATDEKGYGLGVYQNYYLD